MDILNPTPLTKWNRQALDPTIPNKFIDQGAPKTSNYVMLPWSRTTFDVTSASISQTLPTSPVTGDEVRVALASDSGTNALTLTGPGGPFTLTKAGHDAAFLWTGSAWKQGTWSEASILANAKPSSGWSIGDFTDEVQDDLTKTRGYVSWGEIDGIKYWQDIYNLNITWSGANQLTWGQLAGVSTWLRAGNLHPNWNDGLTYTWETF